MLHHLVIILHYADPLPNTYTVSNNPFHCLLSVYSPYSVIYSCRSVGWGTNNPPTFYDQRATGMQLTMLVLEHILYTLVEI